MIFLLDFTSHGLCVFYCSDRVSVFIFHFIVNSAIIFLRDIFQYFQRYGSTHLNVPVKMLFMITCAKTYIVFCVMCFPHYLGKNNTLPQEFTTSPTVKCIFVEPFLSVVI